MHYLFGFAAVCALGLIPLLGCSSSAEGAGAPPCDSVCDDYSDCTQENCPCADPRPVADGTPCAGGFCQTGVCVLSGTVLPCTEQGIRNAIGQGTDVAYRFDCDGTETVVIRATVKIEEDTVLDGEANLRVDGDDEHIVFWVSPGVTAELRGFAVTRGDVGILNEGKLTLTNTTVSGNAGGGIVSGTVGPGGEESGTLTLTNSTVSDNGAGGIANLFGLLTATNSTVSGNDGPGIRNARMAALTSSTVSGNIREGIVNVDGAAAITLTNSLIDDECGGGGITSDGYNIESPGNTCGLEVVIDDLKLGALTDNGGSTKTHALEPGSPAINQIPQEGCVDADNASLTTDQRGRPRPETGGSMCDVGSFESQ